MSEIKALEKLRNTIVTYAADCDERWMLAACDEIEAEIADRYMLLPVDADDVPIHVGDVLERVDGRLNKQAVGCICQFGFNDSSVWCARDFRHVKPRTLENIVADAIQYGHNGITGDRIEGKVAEFCAEIRELLGSDAE